MPITDEVRKYRETVLEQGKVALDEVRKPWYAAVGASEFAYERLQTQLSQLPAEVQARVRKLQSNGRQLDATAVRSAVENAAEQAAGAYGTYAAQARDTYESPRRWPPGGGWGGGAAAAATRSRRPSRRPGTRSRMPARRSARPRTS
jgi:hypothetical protein